MNSLDGTFELRVAQPEDIDALVAFNVQMAWETESTRLDPDTVRSGVQAVLEHSERGFYVLARSTGQTHSTAQTQPIAALMVTTEWSDWRNGAYWWIQSVFVDKDYRRQGIYRQLYQYVKDRARDAGDVVSFRLYVENENDTAQRAYESLGMSQTRYKMYEETFKL